MPEANEGCSGGGGWLMLLMTIGGVALIVLWLALGSSALTLLPLLLLLPARSHIRAPQPFTWLAILYRGQARGPLVRRSREG